jgi:hypothetical protein
VKEKESAKEQYDDAIASGNTAVYAQRDSKDQSITLTLGNLLPGQTARIDVQMMKSLTIESGAYEFAIPVSFMPQYKQHEVEFVQPSEWYGEGIQASDILSEYTFGY